MSVHRETVEYIVELNRYAVATKTIPHKKSKGLINKADTKVTKTEENYDEVIASVGITDEQG